jgi:hypothetical protein
MKSAIAVNKQLFNTAVAVINPIKPDTTYLFIGHVEKYPNTSAVSEGGTGATRFYCEIHHCVFRVLDRCPHCTGITTDEVANE